MIKVITFIIVPLVLLAVLGYKLYFSGWKRGMVQGEAVTKKYFKKKFVQWEEKAHEIVVKQVELEETYKKHGEKIRQLEIKKNLRTESVLDAGKEHDVLASEQAQARAGLAGLQEDAFRMYQENLMRQQMGAQNPLSSLFDGLFPGQVWKPPWY